MGIPGIGKTTLVKAIAHYLDERRVFRDGVIVLSVRGLDQASMIIIRLELLVNKRQQMQQTQQLETDARIVLEKLIAFLKDKELLLILDNAETPSKKDSKCFSEMI
jgi:nucleoside-triphosphatase THEP1